MTSPTGTVQQRLSIPARRTQPPRPLADDELAALLRIADILIPQAGPNPKASDAELFTDYLLLALTARADAFDTIISTAMKLRDIPTDQLWAALETMATEDAQAFDPLSSVLAGAYFMTPQIKALIGYPGQHRDIAPLELASDEIGSGILDPVIDRGSIFMAPPGSS